MKQTDPPCAGFLRGEQMQIQEPTAREIWLLNNIEKLRSYRRKWYHANKEKVLPKMAAQYASLAPCIRSRNKKYMAERYAENPEKYKGKVTAYKLQHPEKKRIWDQNRRAKKLSVGGKLSASLSSKLMQLQRGKCASCRTRLNVTGHHLDHINSLSGGGANEDSNIQLLCPTCNCKKHAKAPIEFMQLMGFLL